jgi:L-gulonate 3-dehydrogenase
MPLDTPVRARNNGREEITRMPKTIAVIGAGLIGRSWAMVHGRAGNEVALYDAFPDALDASERLLDDSLADLETNGLIASASQARARIRRVDTLEAAVDGADWVQENALERVDVKRELFSAMDAMLPPEAIIASSTSAIPCQDITEGMAGAHRMLVAHPANPPYLLPIVELSGAPATSTDTLERSRGFLEGVGMAVITINKPVKGFVLNRLQVALLTEAFKLIEDGVVSGADLDKTLKHGLGLRWSFMGPMETIDLNAPGGIRDYLERFGPAFEEIAAEQTTLRPWTTEKYAKLERERRGVMAPEQLPERTVWRDRRLMALMRHKMQAAEEFGE